MHCLVAEREGKLIGLAHYLIHRSTWSVENICYLNDLFVDPRGRRSGVARKLIEAVYGAADEAGAAKVYWLTHESNAAARLLYDQVAEYRRLHSVHKKLTDLTAYCLDIIRLI